MKLDTRGRLILDVKQVMHCVMKPVKYFRNCVEQCITEELQPPFDFVFGCRPFQPQLACQPQQVNFAFQVTDQIAAFARGPAVGFECHQPPIDAPMNFQHRHALGFCRVGGQCRTDRKPTCSIAKYPPRDIFCVSEYLGKASAYRGGTLFGLGLASRAHSGVFLDNFKKLKPDIQRL